MGKQLELCLDMWQLLKRHISVAFNEDDVLARLDDAGAPWYPKAARKNWEAAAALFLSAQNFITQHETLLSANNVMPVSFKTDFTNASDALNALLTSFHQSQENTDILATNKMTLNNALYNSFTGICLDGQQIFKNNEAMKNKFIFSVVLEMVAGIGTNGFRGLVLDSITNLPVPNALIKSPTLTGTYTTNAEGRYEALQVASGKYTIVIEAEGYLPQTIELYEVDSGVVHTLNFTLVKQVVTP